VNWQDIVLTVANFTFVVALLPALLKDEKPPVSTSVMTAVALVAIAATNASLGLWFAAGVVGITATLWAALAVQQWQRHRRARRSER
jgi:cell division protein FtsW (lipid II flippase)